MANWDLYPNESRPSLGRRLVARAISSRTPKPPGAPRRPPDRAAVQTVKAPCACLDQRSPEQRGFGPNESGLCNLCGGTGVYAGERCGDCKGSGVCPSCGGTAHVWVQRPALPNGAGGAPRAATAGSGARPSSRARVIPAGRRLFEYWRGLPPEERERYRTMGERAVRQGRELARRARTRREGV